MMTQPPHPNPCEAGAAPVEPSSGRALAISTWIFTAVSGLSVLAAGVGYGLVIPAFTAMFDELGKQIPALTQLVIDIPTVAWPLAGVLGFVILVLKNLALKKVGRAVVDAAALAMVGASVPVVATALFVPLIEAIQQMG